MRRYIRHPAHIPIEVTSTGEEEANPQVLHDVSTGGLCFDNPEPLDPGTELVVRVPLVRPAFEARARVVWCDAAGATYEVGVALVDPEDAYRARMVEQLCHIEAYRRRVLRDEGRRLSDEEAAMEWIENYADRFPPPVDKSA